MKKEKIESSKLLRQQIDNQLIYPIIEFINLYQVETDADKYYITWLVVNSNN